MCLGSMCDSHQTALHSETMMYNIVGRVHSGFRPEIEFPNEIPKNSSGSAFCRAGHWLSLYWLLAVLIC